MVDNIINISLGDVERDIKAGVSRRVVLQEISQVAKNITGKGGSEVIKQMTKTKLRETALSVCQQTKTSAE